MGRSSGTLDKEHRRLTPVIVAVGLMVLVGVVIAACSTSKSSGDADTWRMVQSGTDASISWSLYQAELSVTGTPLRSTCLALQTDQPLRQDHGVAFAKSHAGKVPFCGLPGTGATQGLGAGFKVLVVGSNLDPTAGPHDVFGLADPEVTGMTARFSDGTTADGTIQTGTFVLVWSGPKTLENLMALAGDRRVSECSPPGGAVHHLSLQSEDKSVASFTCG